MRVGDVPERLMRAPEVYHVTGSRKTRWYKEIKAGRAPAPIKIGRSSVWRASDIAQWIDDQIAASTRAAA